MAAIRRFRYKVTGVQRCSRCHVTKPLSHYWKCAANSSGLYRYCKECSTKNRRLWGKLNPGKLKVYESRRSKDGAAMQAHRVATVKHAGKKRGLVISPAERRRLLAPGVCCLCGAADKIHTYSRKGRHGIKRGYLHIDHCHKTGKVRGALCFKCNVGLGNFNDDIGLLRKAIQYLKRNQ